jgi:hypothetical protein
MDIETYKGFKIVGKQKVNVVCPWGCPLPEEKILRLENIKFTSIDKAKQSIDKALESQEGNKSTFWERAKCRNTLRRTSPGVKKLLKKYPKLIKVRRYVDPESDEKRRTVEIEIKT